MSAPADDGGIVAGLDQQLVLGASLRERVGDALRASLVSGTLRMDVVYSVPVLAETFGVSITPVREAMLDLCHEGLMVSVRNKGFRVVEITETELDEIIEARRLLEVPVTAALAGRLAPERLAELRSVAEEVRTHAAAGDLVAYVQADRRLHLGLLSVAGNGTVTEIVSGLRDRTRLYGLGRLAREGALVQSSDEHLTLLDALAAGDETAAELAITHHLAHARGIWAHGGAPADGRG